ncbi:hypothetical protein GFY24_19665 [Nocardia sp. SYP-A9097]|uniref:asparagine synthetase B family protein n=1 Tax=Nocardia sp. SYP-A9097 TaxID=2663237 RepID=UPI00129BDEBE|nr:asparagine synthase-related protein [Nocardia sp. SYP-A9097]MRH89634.1 hypothetical protein [Nocardia sp. SYP-A9097]
MTQALSLNVSIPASIEATAPHSKTSHIVIGRTGSAVAEGSALPIDAVERDLAGGRVAVLALGRIHEQFGSGRSSAARLLDLYLEQGPLFAADLAGRFAIVVIDDRTDVVHLVRDHLGIVPLYCTAIDGAVRAGLDAEPLISQPGFPRVFGPSNLVDLFNSTSRVPGTTVLPALREVAPAHVATVSGGRVTQRAYWSPPTRADETLDEQDAIRAVREVVTRAVEREIADLPHPTGFLLSGGLDSSIIDAIAARRAGESIRTFAFRYGSPDHADALHLTADTPFAREVAHHLGATHTEFVFEPGVDHIALLARAVAARGIPGPGDLDSGLIRLLDGLVSAGSASYTGGEGADDIFGGFPWSAPDVGGVANFPWLIGTSAGALIAPALQRDWSFDAELRARWRQALTDHGGDPDDHPDADSAIVSAVGITRFLPFLVDRAERLSRAAGIHAALPFLDPRVVEVGLSLPRRIRRTGDIEKGALRAAFDDLLPASVIARRKSGFAIDVDPAYTTAVRGYLRDRLAAGDSILTDIVDLDQLRTILDSEQWNDGRFAAPPLLPRLVQLDLWARQYDLRFVQHEVVR